MLYLLQLTMKNRRKEVLRIAHLALTLIIAVLLSYQNLFYFKLNEPDYVYLKNVQLRSDSISMYYVQNISTPVFLHIYHR